MSLPEQVSGAGFSEQPQPLPVRVIPITVFDSIAEKESLSLEEVKARVKNETVAWREVSQEIRRVLLLQTAEEHGILPPQLSKNLLSQPLDFLDGHNLSGMYDHTKAEVEKEEPRPNKDIILTMLKEAEVPVVLPKMKPKRKVRVTTLAEVTDLQKLLLQHPVLSREQEQKLFRYLHYNLPIAYLDRDKDFIESFGDEESLDRRNMLRLIEQGDTVSDVIASCNQKLVSVVAVGYGRILSYKEKFASGNLGLRRAIEKFDSERGDAQFSSYALYWIRQKIQGTVRKEGYGIYIPNQVMADKSKILWIKDAFVAIFKRDPTRDELRQQVIVHLFPEKVTTVERIENALNVLDKINQVATSLNKKFGSDNSSEFGDFKSDISMDTAELGITNVTRARVKARLDALLTQQERLVVYHMYDFHTGKTKSIAEVAVELSAPSEIVINLFNSALGRLKKDPKFKGIFSENDMSLEEEEAFITTPFDLFVGEEPMKLKRSLQEAGIPNQKIATYVEIAMRRRRGETIRSIAVALGVTTGIVDIVYCTKLRRLGLIETQRPFSAIDQQEAIRTLYHTMPWLSTRDVAQKVGLAPRTVVAYRSILRTKGLLPPKGAIDKELFISEATEKVGIYLAANPRLSYKETMSRFFNEPKRRRAEFDEEVRVLRGKEFMNQEIANRLGVSLDRVKRSVARLIVQGTISRRGVNKR